MEKLFFQSISRYIGVFLLLIGSTAVMAEMDNDVPMGWAAVPTSVGREPSSGVHVDGTIGGGNGKVVTASGGELADYAGSSEPLVIMASGSFSGWIKVAPHKTIIGTGDGATLKGGFQMGSNTIIRNFNISGGVDGLQVSWNSSVWIDHCDLSACGDGLLDITNGSDKVTVTWVKFSDHHKTMLINNGGRGKTDDDDRNNVTIHHCWYNGTRSRNPRAGYGMIQVLNCYYNGVGYGIHVFWNARVHIERNYFTGTNDAISDHYRNQSQGDWPGPGYVVLVDNYTDNPKNIMKETTTDPERIFNVGDYYMYDWVVTEDVQQVPEVVQKGAGTGPEWGKIGAIPTPGQGYTRVSTTPTLKWTKVGSEPSNKVYFGKQAPLPEVATVEGYEYKPGQLEPGTVYYWKINNGKLWKFRTTGDPVSIESRKTAPKHAAAKKAGALGREGNIIGLKAGKNRDDLYLLNGKKAVKGAITPTKIKNKTGK